MTLNLGLGVSKPQACMHTNNLDAQIQYVFFVWKGDECCIYLGAFSLFLSHCHHLTLDCCYATKMLTKCLKVASLSLRQRKDRSLAWFSSVQNPFVLTQQHLHCCLSVSLTPDQWWEMRAKQNFLGEEKKHRKLYSDSLSLYFSWTDWCRFLNI